MWSAIRVEQIRAEEERTVICELCKPKEGDEQDSARAEADANAIAAVPEMVELLKKAADGLYVDALVDGPELAKDIIAMLKRIEEEAK